MDWLFSYDCLNYWKIHLSWFCSKPAIKSNGSSHQTVRCQWFPESNQTLLFSAFHPVELLTNALDTLLLFTHHIFLFFKLYILISVGIYMWSYAWNFISIVSYYMLYGSHFEFLNLRMWKFNFNLISIQVRLYEVLLTHFGT